LSISEDTDFARWLAGHFAAAGAFTALAVLVDIDGVAVTPLCSTYFSVIGDEVAWHDIVVLFAGSGADWDGAAFFPVAAPAGGPLDNPTARLRLRELERRLDEDRLVLNEGLFFDKRGRRLMIEEAARGRVPLGVLPAIAAEMDRWIDKGHAHDDFTILAKDALTPA